MAESESQQTPHISPSQASYRVSIVRICQKIDHIRHCTVFTQTIASLQLYEMQLKLQASQKQAAINFEMAHEKDKLMDKQVRWMWCGLLSARLQYLQRISNGDTAMLSSVFNSLWPSDAICHWEYWSARVQHGCKFSVSWLNSVMAAQICFTVSILKNPCLGPLQSWSLPHLPLDKMAAISQMIYSRTPL